MIGEVNRSGKARLLALLLLAGVFLSGALAGVAATRLLGAREAGAAALQGERVGRRPPPQRFGNQEQPRRSLAVMLQRSLDLTEDQRDRIEEIFEARRVRTQSVLEDVEPRIQAQRDSTDLEIRAILTEEQRAAFDRMVEQRRTGARVLFRGPPSEREGQP